MDQIIRTEWTTRGTIVFIIGAILYIFNIFLPADPRNGSWGFVWLVGGILGVLLLAAACWDELQYGRTRVDFKMVFLLFILALVATLFQTLHFQGLGWWIIPMFVISLAYSYPLYWSLWVET